MGLVGDRASQMFFRIFGVVYASVAALGMYYGDRPIVGLLANNYADVGLHVAIAIVALYLGFAMKAATPASR